MARDYGKVRAQFWESEGLRALSVSAKFLGLYLLTSPHTNAIGCFRLPIAYIGHDTGLTGEVLEAAMEELRAAGFAMPCERAPWVYIPNYLKHNAPENPNVWRKCVKELEGLPREITAAASIALELYELASSDRMSKEGTKTRVSDEEQRKLKRFGNGFDTLSKGQRPIPSPIPIPEPNQTEPGAVAPSTFDEFWSVFPKQVGEQAARAAHERASEDVRPSVILAGARRYGAAVRRDKTEPRFIKTPAKWLEEGRWTDGTSTGPPAPKSAFDAPEEQAAQKALMEKHYGQA